MAETPYYSYHLRPQLPIAAAITSYGRNCLLRLQQSHSAVIDSYGRNLLAAAINRKTYGRIAVAAATAKTPFGRSLQKHWVKVHRVQTA